MQPTSFNSHFSKSGMFPGGTPIDHMVHSRGVGHAQSTSHAGNVGNVSDIANPYAAALRRNIERLIPSEIKRPRPVGIAGRHAPAERAIKTVRFAGVSNHQHANGGVSDTRQARASTTPDEIHTLCAVASCDLIDQTVADIRKPGVWNEHLLEVLLALKRKNPTLLGANSVRIATSDAMPSSTALQMRSMRTSRTQEPLENPPVESATGPVKDHLHHHLSFVYDGHQCHIVNTKEAFFRAVISVRDTVAPMAVSKQAIDALIEDTADFLQDHWREYYRLVWTKMAKSTAPSVPNTPNAQNTPNLSAAR